MLEYKLKYKLEVGVYIVLLFLPLICHMSCQIFVTLDEKLQKQMLV